MRIIAVMEDVHTGPGGPERRAVLVGGVETPAALDRGIEAVLPAEETGDIGRFQHKQAG